MRRFASLISRQFDANREPQMIRAFRGALGAVEWQGVLGDLGNLGDLGGLLGAVTAP